jgi:hypothetical protein
MVMPQQPLDYAAPTKRVLPPLAALVPLTLGGIICALNFASIVHEGGESFIAPGLGFISLLVFVAGAVTSAVLWHRRRAWAGRLLLLNLLGALLSIVLACAGVPKR